MVHHGPMRCALVGLGRIASLLEDDPLREKPCTHAGAIHADKDCDLIAGCDIDAERRETFARRWNCPSVYDDCEKLLHVHDVDALFVATHPDSHLPMVRLAARYRVPVVVCEKPLADTLRNARRIRRLHRPPDLTILTNHERRYSRDYRAVRRIVDDGTLGRLLSIRGTLYFGSRLSHQAMLLHDGTHLIDIINFLSRGTTRLRKVVGKLSRTTGTSYLHGSAGGEVPVVVEVGSERDHLVFEVELSFSAGRIRVGNGVLSVEESRRSPHYEDYRSLMGRMPPASGPTGYFSNMVADAVSCFREPGREPISSAVDGFEVMTCIYSWRRIFNRT